MDRTFLQGLAKRVALIAREQLGLLQKSNGLSIRNVNDSVVAEVIPSSKLRVKPLLVKVSEGEILIENILFNLSELSGINMFLKDFKINPSENINVDYLVNDELNILIKYYDNVSLNALDNTIRNIFSKAREIWLRIIFSEPEFAFKYFGMYGLDFLGDKVVLVKVTLDDILRNLEDYWLPSNVISVLGADGAFINGDVGIDYINLPIFSTVIKNNDEVDFIIYYFKDESNISSIRLSEIHNLYKKAMSILEKCSGNKKEFLSSMRISHPTELILGEKLWRELVIALKELVLDYRINTDKRSKKIRPTLINSIEIEPISTEYIISEEDREKVLQILPKLESMRVVIESIHNDNKIFTKMVLGRRLVRLLQKFSNLEIYYGSRLKLEEKSIRKTKSSATLNINLKKMGLKKIPDKAKIKLISNGEKEFLIIEL